MASPQTVFGSLKHFEKGGVHVIDGDARHYVFSNVFEVASKSQPYEKVCVGKNLRYVIEAVRAEGNSHWYAASHDEAALVMDGTIEVHLVKPDREIVPESKEGTVFVGDEPPKGKKMGWIKAWRGHMVLLPKGSSYQFRATKPAVILIQSIKGDLTIERWADICQK